MELDDKEFEVIRELYKLLKPLDRVAQDRIMSYVHNRLASDFAQKDMEELEKLHDMPSSCLSSLETNYLADRPLNYAIGRL